jgi:TatD DNase family protein
MRIIDSHCHLEDAVFDDCLETVLDEAKTAGVVALLTCATRPDQWPRSQAIAQRHPQVHFAWGIHPWFAEESHFETMEELRTAKTAGAAAIGEIGLDKKIKSPSFDLQQRLFEAQLGVAMEINLPIAVHCRGAFNDLLESVKRVGIPKAGGMVHAFSGSAEVAEALTPFGFYFSMGGALSYKPSKKRLAVLERVYPERFLLETDSPDMPPVQASERPNQPARIRYNLTGAASMLQRTEEEVAEQAALNAQRLFGFRA